MICIYTFAIHLAFGRLCVQEPVLGQVIVETTKNHSQWPEGVYFSPEFKDFVAQCMQQKPEDRPTADQLRSHPFITKYANADVDMAAFFKSVMGESKKSKDKDKEKEKEREKEKEKEKEKPAEPTTTPAE